MTVNTNDTTHTISIVPRFFVESVTKEIQDFIARVISDSGIMESNDNCIKDSIQEDFLDVVITDSFRSVNSSLDNDFEILNGKLLVTFDYNFEDEHNYQIKIIHSNTQEVVYRGEIIATTQETQEYLATNNRYNWN